MAGTAEYDHAEEWPQLSQVRTALDTVAERLRSLDYVLVGKVGYSLNPTKGELVRLLQSTPTDTDVVIAYYTGHGYVDGLHYLVTKDSTVQAPQFIVGSAVPSRDLPSLLAIRDAKSGMRRDPQPYLLIIVDTCFSGSAAVQIARDAFGEVIDPERTWVIVSARAAQYAQEGAFPAALRQAMAESTAGQNQQFVSPDVLVGSINDRLPDWQEVRSYPPVSGVVRVPPFFPNPEYQPVPSGLTLADQKHWLSRLRGIDAEATSGYYIAGGAGRMTAVRDIARWVTEPKRGAVAVVTGGPGSGKSTLLALFARLTDPLYRDTLLAEARSLPIVRAAAEALGSSARLIAVNGRGLNVDQIAAAVGSGLGRDGRTVVGLVGVLDHEPIRDHAIVLLDALDEAEEPGVLVDLLASKLAVRYGLRVLIGTRRHLLGSVPNPSLVVDLDQLPYADQQALTDYVAGLLVAAKEPGISTPYQQLDADKRNAIAEAVSENAAGSFLIGQQYALTLRGSERPIDTQRRDWMNLIPANLGAAFETDLARLGGRSARVRPLLTALAWAKGPGLPWENIWVPVTNAIRQTMPDPDPIPLNDDDVRWLREHAGGYVVEDVGPGGRSVFRLFHATLAAYLRATGEGPRSDAVSEAHSQQINGLITKALLDTVALDKTAQRQWRSAHPYLRTYLAQHAMDAGVFSALVQDVDFLAVADPATLYPLFFRERWMKDVFDATLALRLDEWELLDAEALAAAAAWAQAAMAGNWNEQLNAAVMEGVQRLLTRTKGDPPVDASVREAARKFITSPPDDKLVSAMEPLVQEMLPNLADLLADVQARLGDAARAQARLVLAAIAQRLAIPRVELLRLTGRLSRVPEGSADPFGEALQEGFDCTLTDPDRSENLLVEALNLAEASRPPNDRFLVVRTLLHRSGKPLQPDTLRSCARALAALDMSGLDRDRVAQEIGRAAMYAEAAGLAPELFPIFAQASEVLRRKTLG